MPILPRKGHAARVEAALRRAPVTAIVGPRQAGKTTLARIVAGSRRDLHWFDLEHPEDLAAFENPMRLLEPLRGLVVIDEIQHRPDLFRILRVLADRRPAARFLVLGSASGDLLRQTSETLAGRIEYIELPPFSLDEVGADRMERLWLRGGFPPSFLARSEAQSRAWRDAFVRTFLERDIPQLGFAIPAATLRRFWEMASHYHGQLVNFSDLGRSLGIADTTARRYLEIFAGTFLVRLLPPWHENLGKRLVKSPKLYLRDSGIFHTLQRIETRADLLRHPKLGASWEGFALEETIRRFPGYDPYFFRTYAGAELDLLLVKGRTRLAFQFTCADAPRVGRSFFETLRLLRVRRAWLVHPGKRSWRIAPGVEAVPLRRLPTA